MTGYNLFRPFGLAVLAAGVLLAVSACEMQFGNAALPTTDGGTTPAINTDTTGKKTNTDGKTTPDDGGGTEAPGVPTVLAPGNGEGFSGAGARVTFIWTDAPRAEQFELVILGLGSSGWQQAVDKVPDAVQFTYTLSSQPWPQFRFKVRSIGADSQTSAYTGWSSFTWSH